VGREEKRTSYSGNKFTTQGEGNGDLLTESDHCTGERRTFVHCTAASCAIKQSATGAVT